MSREEIDGVKVVERTKARIETNNITTKMMELSTYPDIDEVLLDDGRVVYQCASRNDDGSCLYWKDNPISVRAHLRTHSDRMSAKRAQAEAAEALRRAQAAQDELNAARARKSNGAKKGWENRKVRTNSDPEHRQAMRVAGVEGLLETVTDGLDEIEQLTKRARLILIQAQEEVIRIQGIDPEILEKATKWDSLRASLQ